MTFIAPINLEIWDFVFISLNLFLYYMFLFSAISCRNGSSVCCRNSKWNLIHDLYGRVYDWNMQWNLRRAKKRSVCAALWLRPMNSSMRSKKALTMNWWKNRGRHNLDFYIPILFSPCRSQFSLAAQCVCCLIGGRGSMSVSSAKLFSLSFNLASRESSLRSSRDMCKFCWCRPFVIKQAQFHYEFRFNPVLRFSSSAHFSSFERVFDSMMMLCNFMLDQVSSTPNYCVCLLCCRWRNTRRRMKYEISRLHSLSSCRTWLLWNSFPCCDNFYFPLFSTEKKKKT